MTRKRPIRLVITPGDPEGIGPEIVRKAFLSRRFPAGVEAFCVGAARPLAGRGVKVRELKEQDLEGRLPRKAGVIPVLPAPPGPAGTHAAGFQSGWSIETAARLIRAGQADALVTGPISKERFQKGGFAFEGHTDFLAKLTDTPQVTMMLANEKLRVSLVTVHVALKDVPSKLTVDRIEGTFDRTYAYLRDRLGIRRPRIAICGLNPHAGESGLFGDEESRVIRPALERLRARHGLGERELTGPHPSDTFFAVNASAPAKQRYDAVLCMYHDQGLIPVKLLDFPNTVNITLGLPLIRTSVDHGVAFDIAGKNKADPSSLMAALELAARLARRKRA